MTVQGFLGNIRGETEPRENKHANNAKDQPQAPQMHIVHHISIKSAWTSPPPHNPSYSVDERVL